VYVSESLALSVLEQFVNVGFEGRYMQYVYMRIEVPASIKMETIEVKSLPAGWNDLPVLSSTMDIGSKWIRKAETAILKVPSAIVPVEYNYLLNPLHHDFKKIKISDPLPYRLDSRIWKT
jgi:RES domain-containing protein